MDQGTRRAIAYFGLVAIFTVPFWILGAAVKFELLPGLPIAAFAIICPTLAAGVLSFRQGGWVQLRRLLGRALDFKKASWRLFVVALINPALFGLAFLVSRLLGGGLPDPDFAPTRALMLLALFLPTALLEELGWSGYALDHLQVRHSQLVAGLILGLFWAVWHLPALVEVGRSIEWIAWWGLWTISARVIMVWVYNRVGFSVFAVALFHAMSNVCWQIYPVSGSYFDPEISALITLGVAAALTAWPGSRANIGREAA